MIAIHGENREFIILYDLGATAYTVSKIQEMYAVIEQMNAPKKSNMDLEVSKERYNRHGVTVKKSTKQHSKFTPKSWSFKRN